MMHDKNAKHKSWLTNEWLQKRKIIVSEWPSHSLDLNHFFIKKKKQVEWPEEGCDQEIHS